MYSDSEHLRVKLCLLLHKHKAVYACIFLVLLKLMSNWRVNLALWWWRSLHKNRIVYSIFSLCIITSMTNITLPPMQTRPKIGLWKEPVAILNQTQGLRLQLPVLWPPSQSSIYCTGGTRIQYSRICCHNPIRSWPETSIHPERSHSEYSSVNIQYFYVPQVGNNFKQDCEFTILFTASWK